MIISKADERSRSTFHPLVARIECSGQWFHLNPVDRTSLQPIPMVRQAYALYQIQTHAIENIRSHLEPSFARTMELRQVHSYRANHSLSRRWEVYFKLLESKTKKLNEKDLYQSADKLLKDAQKLRAVIKTKPKKEDLDKLKK